VIADHAVQSSSLREAPRRSRRERRAYLEGAAEEVIGQVLEANPYLSAERGSGRMERIDRADAYSGVLSGRSPVTQKEERVIVFTRPTSAGRVLTVLFIAPEEDYRSLGELFERMVLSLRVGNVP